MANKPVSQNTDTVAKKKTQSANARPGTNKPGKTAATSAPKREKTPEPEQLTIQEPRPQYGRMVGAFVCLFLALFCVLGLFGIDALFINFLSIVVKGFIGYGFYLMIPELLLCMVILFRHPTASIGFRMGCALLTPVAFGALLHLFLCKQTIAWGFSMLGTLFRLGSAVEAGGLFSGFIAMLLSLVFSKIGAGILLTIAFLLLLLASFRITVLSVTRAIQNRPRPEPLPDKDIDPAAAIVNHVAQKRIDAVQKKRSVMADFDLPIDDPSVPGEKESKASKAAAKAKQSRSGDLQEQINRSLQAPEPVQTVVPEIEPAYLRNARARSETAASAPASAPAPEPVPVSVSVPDTFAASAWVDDELPVTAVPDQKPEPAPWEDETLFATQPPVSGEPSPASPPEHGASMAPVVEAVAQEVQAAPDALIEAAAEPEPDQDVQAPADSFQILPQDIVIVEHPYKYPPVTLLGEIPPGGADGTEEMRLNAARLSDTLQSFGIDATITNVTRGPSVTRYELELDRGVKLSKLTNLADDIALALGASGVRISAIPDRISVVGVEVPNKVIRTVYAREVLEASEFQKHKSKVAFAVGVNISGEKIVGDITKLPHLLIAGTTGSGKSVCINGLIISLLYRSSPEEVRLIMIDPKMIELGVYNGIPHLLVPVVTDPKKASGALQWAVTEMMRRYQLLADEGARDLDSYNLIMEHKGQDKLPKIVIVIDELADLMLVAAKEVEESICRIAQLARAAGMHLIIATQRPSADVITGIMKANIPSRIAFAVSSQLESRIILDTTGAEKLVGKGDMLYAPLGTGKPQRVQGCFISSDEVENIVAYIKQTTQADYSDDIQAQIEQKAMEQGNGRGGQTTAATPAQQEDDSTGDEMLPAAVDVILETGQASVSMLQRRLKLGYARAARIMDEMEEQGVVGPFEGSKPRQLLITREQWQQMNQVSSGQQSFLEEE